MNCKFCGNFVPDGKDSCPVCGRRPEEEPIGKLLSENQPGAGSKPEPEVAPVVTDTKKHPKGLQLPFLLIILGVGTWVAGVMMNAIAAIQKFWVAVFGGGGADISSSTIIDTDVAEKAAFDKPEFWPLIGMIALGALASIFAVWGVIMFFKRLYNRVKY